MKTHIAHINVTDVNDTVHTAEVPVQTDHIQKALVEIMTMPFILTDDDGILNMFHVVHIELTDLEESEEVSF